MALAETLEVAKIFIRGVLSIIKLVDEEKISKKYIGASHPLIKDNNPRLTSDYTKKARAPKNEKLP